MAAGAALAVTIPAWRLGALSVSGAIAATVVGTVVLGSAGLGPALVMVFFFLSSSALSRLPGGGERSRRGAKQVLANGFIAAAAAMASGEFPLARVAFLGALAAAAADTWATEIGTRLGRNPRSILTMRPRPPGSSGAVSIQGTTAAALGGLAVALAGSWWLGGPAGSIIAVTLAGFIGSTVDSVLGDGLQAVYSCSECGARPEVARHPGCGRPAKRMSGLPGLDNDVVNWIATAAGAAAAMAGQLLWVA